MPPKHGAEVCGGNFIFLMLMCMIMVMSVIVVVVMFFISIERECVQQRLFYSRSFWSNSLSSP